MDTKYSDYSINDLHALFSTDQWGKLSLDDKVEACQEVENRYAAENNTTPCTVRSQDMEGSCYGWQSGNTIALNSHLLNDGQFVTHYQDQNGNWHEARVDALAPGWNTLDTVYHEGTHGIQEKTGNMPSTYIDPDMDHDLYRIQGCEKQAYAQGQLRTLQAMETYEKEAGKLDEAHVDYLTSVRNDSFNAALAEAARNYNDPNIEQTLADVIHDRDAGIVRDNPSPSYQAINSLCDNYGVHSSVQNSQNANNDLNNTADPGTAQAQNETDEKETAANTNENDSSAIVDDGLNSGDTSAAKDEADMDDGLGNDPGVSGSDVTEIDDGLGDDPGVSSSGVTEIDDGLGDDPGLAGPAAAEIDDGLAEAPAETEAGNTQGTTVDDGLGAGSDDGGASSSGDMSMDDD